MFPPTLMTDFGHVVQRFTDIKRPQCHIFPLFLGYADVGRFVNKLWSCVKLSAPGAICGLCQGKKGQNIFLCTLCFSFYLITLQSFDPHRASINKKHLKINSD